MTLNILVITVTHFQTKIIQLFIVHANGEVKQLVLRISSYDCSRCLDPSRDSSSMYNIIYILVCLWGDHFSEERVNEIHYT